MQENYAGTTGKTENKDVTKTCFRAKQFQRFIIVCLFNDGFMSGRCYFFTRNWVQKTCSKGFGVVYLVYNHVSSKTVLDFYPLPLPRAASPPCPPLHRCSLVLGLTSGQSRRWRTFRPSIGTGQVPTFPLVGRSEARQSPKCSKVSVGPCCLFF